MKKLLTLVATVIFSAQIAYCAEEFGALNLNEARKVSIPIPAIPETAISGNTLKTVRRINGVVWPNCQEASVSIDPSGDIYRNGDRIGRNASTFRVNCVGDVAWVTTGSEMYLNETQLGRNASFTYGISAFSSVVAWSESDGDMHKNDETLGRDASTFAIAPYNGVVVWKATDGDIYKDTEELGRNANSFSLSYKGIAAWSNTSGDMYRDAQQLGRNVRSFIISGNTGDVAWMSTGDELYKNSSQISRDAATFKINPDGQVLWVDRDGVSHATR
ncbi:MAG TPA: hypothetical protein DCL44_06645 [Elusimicrobia bacterium]|nr:hypothetical protein [Elusimicrobiota bacterium]